MCNSIHKYQNRSLPGKAQDGEVVFHYYSERLTYKYSVIHEVDRHHVVTKRQH